MRIILLAAILLMSFNSIACDCLRILDDSECNQIFRGTVLKVKRIESPYIRYEVTFKIEKAIKGKQRKSIKVNVHCLNAGCCGIPFAVGEKYEVYAFIKNEREYTNECTKTTKIDKS